MKDNSAIPESRRFFMTERSLFCKINQQPCGTDDQGDGSGGCGACVASYAFLRGIYDTLEPGGATDFWTNNEGDILRAGYTSSSGNKIVMRIQRGDTVG